MRFFNMINTYQLQFWPLWILIMMESYHSNVLMASTRQPFCTFLAECSQKSTCKYKKSKTSTYIKVSYVALNKSTSKKIKNKSSWCICIQYQNKQCHPSCVWYSNILKCIWYVWKNSISSHTILVKLLTKTSWTIVRDWWWTENGIYCEYQWTENWPILIGKIEFERNKYSKENEENERQKVNTGKFWQVCHKRQKWWENDKRWGKESHNTRKCKSDKSIRIKINMSVWNGEWYLWQINCK